MRKVDGPTMRKLGDLEERLCRMWLAEHQSGSRDALLDLVVGYRSLIAATHGSLIGDRQHRRGKGTKGTNQRYKALRARTSALQARADAVTERTSIEALRALGGEQLRLCRDLVDELFEQSNPGIKRWYPRNRKIVRTAACLVASGHPRRGLATKILERIGAGDAKHPTRQVNDVLKREWGQVELYAQVYRDAPAQTRDL